MKEVGIPLDLTTRNWVSHEGGGDSHWTCPQRDWDSHEDYPQTHGHPMKKVGIPQEKWGFPLVGQM